ncbi:LysR family transcriptional regulator [Phenylobacterium sp.]|uniref:LysR family transcriptional regulator n=1 Tax=Phenylobacterium sp. TaxID=1871053 RepID=UPI0026222842|nr:LysR family transcriptional regulator [Phenylobacterium sp.]
MNSPDLNLLRVFDVMLEERNVTRAGARLGLTQSAVSHALNRLRYSLNDELFVRGPSGMQPTPRALEMGPQVHAALSQLQSAIVLSDFDPAVSERRFTLSAGAYACAVLAPALVGRLAREAPLSELAVVEQAPDILERLDARRVDFLVGGVLEAPERFARDVILTETLVWVVRAGHPLATGGPVDLAKLSSVPHVVVARTAGPEAGAQRRGLVTQASWEDAGAFETALAGAGLKRRIGVTVPDTYSALAIAARSDMATLMPRRLAQVSAQSGRISLIEAPYPSPAVEVALLYLKERLNEPAVAWMRGLIDELAAAL